MLGILAGHLDSTFRGWSATLATRVRLVVARLVLVFALPSGFSWETQSCTVHVSSWRFVHGIEASFLAVFGLRKLRAAIVKVVWSRRQPLANPGAVLSLLDGPVWVVLLPFASFGSGFVCSDGFLASRPGEVARA